MFSPATECLFHVSNLNVSGAAKHKTILWGEEFISQSILFFFQYTHCFKIYNFLSYFIEMEGRRECKYSRQRQKISTVKFILKGKDPQTLYE